MRLLNKRLKTNPLPVLLLAASLLAGGAALACEKHLNGHSNSSDTSSEAAGR